MKIKRTLALRFTAPAAGKVVEINRGAKRVLQSVVIQLEGNDQETYDKTDAAQLSGLSREAVEKTLVDSGVWTAFRTRPFSKIPAVGSTPSSIFVTAMDTNPLAADPAVVIADRKDDFENGLQVISLLTDGKVFVCKASGADIPTGSASVDVNEFAGPHPAGLAGTHIHHLDPVGANKTVWHVGYQDVMAIGSLFTTGEIDSRRVVAVGGPCAKNPRLVRTVAGAGLCSAD